MVVPILGTSRRYSGLRLTEAGFLQQSIMYQMVIYCLQRILRAQHITNADKVWGNSDSHVAGPDGTITLGTVNQDSAAIAEHTV